MQPVLLQLELISKEKAGLKERVFEWVADLSQGEFDQLCCEIISLDSFFKKYEGALVTDNLPIVERVRNALPKVELVITMTGRHYKKAFFYRWLENIHVSGLQSICWGLEDCCDQAMEVLNTYVVPAIRPIFPGTTWRIESPFAGNLGPIANVVRNWAHQPFARNAYAEEIYT